MLGAPRHQGIGGFELLQDVLFGLYSDRIEGCAAAMVFASRHREVVSLDGSQELLQLAHLLQIAAQTADGIAKLRLKDAVELDDLARQLEAIADRFEQMTRQADGHHPVAP